jgi:hypothetical protein
MVLFVGWGGGVTQDLGEVAPTICPNCHNHVFLHHVHADKRISLYFVPMVPYASDAYLACPICRSGVHLKPEQVPAVDRMRASTARFRRGLVDEPAYRVAVERFWGALGVAPSGAQVLHPSPTIPPPAIPAAVPGVPAPPPPAALSDQLAGLARLHADGLLTDDEFAAAKRRVLEG